MSKWQLFISAGLPSIMALIGILLAHRSADRLEKCMDDQEQRNDQRFGRIESRLDRIEAALREFYRTIGQQVIRIDNLEKRGA